MKPSAVSKHRNDATGKRSLWARLGPGLITGAADDDPSGIATYSQVGAGIGYGILWTAIFTLPLMVGIQTVSARIGLGRKLLQARGFYAILSIATGLGVALNFTAIDPLKAMFWSAVINGVIAVPVMAVMMLMAVRPDIMGRFAITRRLKLLGWLATAVMAIAVVAMVVTWGQ